MQQEDLVILGRIVGLYGVKGWLRLHSFTSPIQNILKYQPWQIGDGTSWKRLQLESGKVQGKGLVIKLQGIDDRDQAADFLGSEIAITREQLPALRPNTYYWTDLQGLRVRTHEGIELGVLDYLFETGANDVMVVKGERERLIPWIRDQVVLQVDLDEGFIEVDWNPDF